MVKRIVPLTSQPVSEHIETVIRSFLDERRSRRLSKRTIEYYADILDEFAEWIEKKGKTQVDEVTPDDVRQYMIDLEKTGHNPGGIAAHYRPIRALFNFWEYETEGQFRAPTHRAKAPKVSIHPLPPIPVEQIKAMIECNHGRNVERDEAILRVLFDTAARRQEILDVNIADISLETGTIIIHHGKGDKSRPVFIGRKTRRALRRYFATRTGAGAESPLFIDEFGERLKARALREILRRRAHDAGINREPGTHEFRRAAALEMLRNGMDVVTLMRQMGHSDIKVTTRYLDQTEDDLRKSHELHSPVDNSDLL